MLKNVFVQLMKEMMHTCQLPPPRCGALRRHGAASCDGVGCGRVMGEGGPNMMVCPGWALIPKSILWILSETRKLKYCVCGPSQGA